MSIDYYALMTEHQARVDEYHAAMRRLDSETNEPAVAAHGAACRAAGIARERNPFSGAGTSRTGHFWALVWEQGWDHPRWYGHTAAPVCDDAVMPAAPRLAALVYPPVPDVLARRPQLRCTGNAAFWDTQSPGPYHGK